MNRLELPEFVAQVGAIFEHSPWVAERVYDERPFSSIDELHRAMMAALRNASHEDRVTLVRAHPDLAGSEAQQGTLTDHSSGEQERLGLTSLTAAEATKMAAINRAYREKFGFPCIVALRLHNSRDSLLREMERRLDNDVAAELGKALEQIGHIARGRLDRIFGRG